MQLTDIARPGVAHQSIHHGGRDRFDLPPNPAGKPLCEVAHQPRNVVTALSSFFLAKDLDLLVAAPVDWLRLYGAKLLETTGHSSWMVVLVATPVLTAYGIIYQGGFLYPFVAIAAVLPFLFIPAAIGTAITLVLVNIFPARRTRDILSVIAVLAALLAPSVALAGLHWP